MVYTRFHQTMDDYDSIWEDESGEWENNSKKSARMLTMQELNAQIVKLERENFQLKLRIHLNETKGTVQPITAAVPKKSQRELQIEQESQILRVEKEQLELKVQQLQSQLRREAETKEELISKEASLQNKITELKNYTQLIEREKGLNRLRYGPGGLSPCRQTIGIISPTISRTSIAVNTEPITNGAHFMMADTFRSEETDRAMVSMQHQLHAMNQERLLLIQQLAACEESRKREAMLMGKRANDALEELTTANRSLKLQNKELYDKVRMLDAKATALKKAANTELSNQLFYHQTALEKVHQEQALLIEELQKLKKACPLQKPVTEFCRKDGIVDVDGDTHSTPPTDSSHFIRCPRSLDQSGRGSSCLIDWEAQPDPTQALEPDKPSDGNSEEQIMELNKKLHEKNSKLALKLKKTRESLKKAIGMLEHSEKDKEGMEKIICRQLHRTHLILSDVKETLIKSKDGDSAMTTPRTYSDLNMSKAHENC